MSGNRTTLSLLFLLLALAGVSIIPHLVLAAQPASTNLLTDLTLEAGQASILHYYQTVRGKLQWTIDLAKQPDDRATLEYGIHLQPASGGKAIMLYSGVITALKITGSLDSVPAGDVYVSLRNTAKVQEAAGVSSRIVFNTSFGPLLAPDDNPPPRLRILSPLPGLELWGNDTEVVLTVEGEPYAPIYLQGSNMAVAASADGYAEALVPLSVGLEQQLDALCVGPTGHVATGSVRVIKHMLTEPPVVEAAYSHRPTIRLHLSDTSAIDLQRSTLTLGDLTLQLQLDSARNVLFATPDADLPFGSMDAQLQLVGRADKFAGRQPILESFSWLVQVGGSRTINLWPGQHIATINGESYALDAAPFIDRVSASTMVPFRFVAEAMGAEVAWLPETGQVTFQLGTKSILLTLGSLDAEVDGEAIAMPLAPRLIGGRTMVPLRFVSEQLGASVRWDGTTGTIAISVDN